MSASETDTGDPRELTPPATAGMEGRQVFAYFGLLFLFLILTRALLAELHSVFDLALLPKLAGGIQQTLDSATEFDNVLTTVHSLLFSFLFSLPVAIVYRVTKDDGQFDPALAQTIVLLSMVVTAVMVVISGDLARAFGLAGVVGAVRFRNSLDDAKDAVFVFLAIAIGMACGARAYTVGLWTSLILTSPLYFMWYFHFGQLPGGLLASHKSGKAAKKGKREETRLAPEPSVEAHGQTDRMIGQQFRLAQMADEEREPGEKKSNAAVLLEARDLSMAQSFADGVLESSDGKWRLANVVGRGSGGGGTIEFVGRLAKGSSPSALFQGLLLGAGPAGIECVEFRSLKGLRAKSEAAVAAGSPVVEE